MILGSRSYRDPVSDLSSYQFNEYPKFNHRRALVGVLVALCCIFRGTAGYRDVIDC